MLAATTVALVGLPLIVPTLVVVDLVRVRPHGRRGLALVRVYLFLLQYMINDSVEIVLAPFLWVRAGLGTQLDSAASIARHERLQWWSLELLERRAHQLLGLRLDLDADAAAGWLAPGPVVVVSRHVSLFDASLPGVVCRRAGFRARGVIMAELLADPGFDLLYARLGSVFIPRDDGPRARSAIERMTATSASRSDETAFVIFPEGRLFRPDRLERARSRLAERDPDRAERLQGLTRLLPPRPAGVRALLDALPGADLVVLHHRGLDRFARLTDLVAAAPVGAPVTVWLDRIDRSTIPEGEAFGPWLDQLWLDLDRDLQHDVPRELQPDHRLDRRPDLQADHRLDHRPDLQADHRLDHRPDITGGPDPA